MHALKWYQLNTRMFFRPDDGGGGGGSEASATPAASAPDGGGSAGGDVGATPSAAPSTGGDAGSAAPAQEFDWSALGSSDDLDHIAIPAEAATPPKPPAEPPKEPVQPAPPPQPQPAPQQPPPVAAAETPGEAAPLSAADPWRIAEALEANRDVALAHLAQTKFALSEQDIKDLDTDVTSAVPKLLARVFLESQVSMQKFLAQAVPGMVQKYNKVTGANEGAEKKFFDAHKALDMNNPQHRATTVRIASMYRQANPGIPLDQLIAEVGPMVMASLKINGQQAVPAQPAPRAAPRGGTPFMPAVNGGGGLSPTPEPGNPWEGLGRTYDE